MESKLITENNVFTLWNYRCSYIYLKYTHLHTVPYPYSMKYVKVKKDKSVSIEEGLYAYNVY